MWPPIRRPTSSACIEFSGRCESDCGSVIITLLIVFRFISQVWRRDGSDCIHALPQNAGDAGNIRVLLLDALLLLHRR
jgi:hypothetical protein